MFDFYVQNEYWFAAAQLILAMLGMGATLSPADFGRVASDPKGFTIGIVLQMLVVPVVAYLFILFVSGSPGLAVGLAVCAAIPGGAFSNILTLISRGHVALSVSLTAITMVACLVTTPIVLGLLISQHLPADFQMPTQRIALEIGWCLLLPLVLGMLVLRFSPGFAPAFSRWCIKASLLVIALIVIGALGAGRLDFAAFGAMNIVRVLLFICTLAVLSVWVPRLLNSQPGDVVAINYEIVVRNTNLGLLIKASLFPAVVGVADPVGDHALFTILAYGGLMLVFAGVIYSRNRRKGLQPMASPAE